MFSRFFFYRRRWDGVMGFMLMCRKKNKCNPAEERLLDGDKTTRAACVFPAVADLMDIIDKGKESVLLKILWKAIIVCYLTGGVGNCPRGK